MDQPSLEAALADLNLPAIHYFSTIDSTNAEASRWLDAGAPHLALVVADEQISGRGRAERRWITKSGTGLALSLVFRALPVNQSYASRLTGLGALAVREALLKLFALPAQIKWPNDVLLTGRKVAGVLVETRWNGDVFHSAILGIGINIAPESVSEATLPAEWLDFPATCVETVAGHTVDRLEIIYVMLKELLTWLPNLSSPAFVSAWESALAFRNQLVELSDADGVSKGITRQVGKVMGLTQDGSLRLLTPSGNQVVIAGGDVRLRPTQPEEPAVSA